jgi:uncharacterized protein (DUF2141 family)
MKTLLSLFIVLMTIAAPTHSDNPLQIHFKDLKEVKGKIYLQVHNESNEMIKQEVVPVTSKNPKVLIKGLPKGKLAVRAFQDLNGNGKLDIGLFGPKEPYGFSNNVRGTFSEPDFREQLFSFPKEHEITIALK